jgi:CheY-like chemotaxis protein
VTQLTAIGGSPAPWIPRTVLVVDDEPDMRECLRDVLADEGYLVVLASNGQIALDLLPILQRPCGIILDVTMPVMSGPELYRAMRAIPALADIPVVFWTSDPSRAPDGLPVMQKPVGMECLLGTVAALF